MCVYFQRISRKKKDNNGCVIYIHTHIYKRISREKKDNNGRGARTLATTAKAVTRYFSEEMQPPSSSHCSPADAE